MSDWWVSHTSAFSFHRTWGRSGINALLSHLMQMLIRSNIYWLALNTLRSFLTYESALYDQCPVPLPNLTNKSQLHSWYWHLCQIWLISQCHAQVSNAINIYHMSIIQEYGIQHAYLTVASIIMIMHKHRDSSSEQSHIQYSWHALITCFSCITLNHSACLNNNHIQMSKITKH